MKCKRSAAWQDAPTNRSIRPGRIACITVCSLTYDDNLHKPTEASDRQIANLSYVRMLSNSVAKQPPISSSIRPHSLLKISQQKHETHETGKPLNPNPFPVHRPDLSAPQARAVKPQGSARSRGVSRVMQPWLLFGT